jgi:glycine cleavage system H protein
MTTMFTADHEWINIEDHEAAVVGITLHAQDALGDVVFVELPEVGRSYAQGEVAGVVESVKAAADIYMPVSGEVVEVNEALKADPALANTDPMGSGWFFKVRVSDMSQFEKLMDPPGYDALLKTL